jgi:Asp-tRNA(Asn)/Glu-tRNA(Gln) amidotransferase A subunit family amidase
MTPVVTPLAATGPAPLGLGSTANPVFAVPGSILGVPTVSLPVLSAAGLPLGLQLVGFEGGDARLFAGAAWLSDLLAAAA